MTVPSRTSFVHEACPTMSTRASIIAPAGGSAAVKETRLEPILDTFTRFPELPFELRCTIWNMTFDTPNHVHLHCRMSYGHDTSDPCRGPWERPGPLPASLHVCHESRLETLKHVQVVLHSDYNPRTKGSKSRDKPYFWNYHGEDNFVPKPFWFNSGRDTTYIDVEEWYKPECHWFSIFLRFLSSKGLRVSDTVRDLEVRLWSHKPTCGYQWLLDIDMARFMRHFMTDHGQLFRNLILLFGSLENLCFTMKPSATPTDQTRKAAFLRQVQCWLELKKDYFNNGKPPAVYLADGKTENGGEDVMPRNPHQA